MTLAEDLAAMARTSSSSALSTAVPVAGRAAMSLPFSTAIASRGSLLTTASATIIALAILLVLWVMRRADAVAVVLSVLLMTLSMAAFGGFMLTAYSAGIAELFGKDTKHIGTMTGRLPLWSAIWEISKNHPFGSGFGAAERFVTALIGGRYWIGWTAGHSHNGFISAWLGAGFPGLLLSICLVLSILSATARMAVADRVLVVPLMILMITNNISFPAFGGQFNLTWMIVMAMACGPYWVSRHRTGRNIC
jgi:O-antigen ligase